MLLRPHMWQSSSKTVFSPAAGQESSGTSASNKSRSRGHHIRKGKLRIALDRLHVRSVHVLHSIAKRAGVCLCPLQQRRASNSLLAELVF
eukprot:617495-Alexandrium_andersonii.AAC.1